MGMKRMGTRAGKERDERKDEQMLRTPIHSLF